MVITDSQIDSMAEQFFADFKIVDPSPHPELFYPEKEKQLLDLIEDDIDRLIFFQRRKSPEFDIAKEEKGNCAARILHSMNKSIFDAKSFMG